MEFEEIFDAFLLHKNNLKVVHVGSCDGEAKPNSAPKLLIDIVEPNRVYFLDYKSTQTYANVCENPSLSVSFMDDQEFHGYRLNGSCEILEAGEEYEDVRKQWRKKVLRYEADRIAKRVIGEYSARQAENVLPPDFVIVRFTASEGSVVRPDRVFRARLA